jgi:tyrosyl-tRNA synthetase
MQRFLRFDDSPNGALLVNNHDWIGKFSYIDFLRDVGKHFPVNVMLTKDSVRQRLDSDSGLSYTEFSYMLLQSYDFVHLHRTYGCELQAGGSDQWGNIVAGIDLARRLDGAQLYGLTSPLLAKSDGKKMGKTESGTLWLDPNRTPPYQFFQYWINLDDADTEKTLKIFTDLSQKEIVEILAKHGTDPGKRFAQHRLAEEITKLVHGDDGLSIAKRATEIFFGDEISQLDDAQLTSIFADVPSKELPRSRLDTGLSLIDVLHESGLVPSKAEARRTVQQGGAYINNRQMTDLDAKLGPECLASESVMVVRSGKKKYALLRFV